jgi:phosphonate transport system substrate-binding protein
LAACSWTPYPEVSVDMAAPKVATVATPAPRARTLRFSVAAMQSPRDTFEAYSRVFEALGRRIGDEEVEFIQRRTYAEVNEMLAAGKLDAALICTGGYLELERSAPGAVEVLAVPVVGGRTTYRSLIIVPTASRDESLQDLRGKRFAFTDELSMSGHAYAARLLADLGSDERAYFSSVAFTRSHDRSIEAVAKGLFDGAAVDSLVFDQLVQVRPALRTAVRVIHRSPELGVSPVVASTRLPKERRDAIRKALLQLASDPESMEALKITGIERFVEAPPGLYVEAQRIMVGTR